MNIVILDDDSLQVVFLKKILISLNPEFNITTYDNPVIALNIMKKEGIPNILLLDIQMPIINGWEFLDNLNQDKNLSLSKLAVYIITAKKSVHQSKIKDYPFVKGIIEKPIEIDELNNSFLDCVREF